MPPPSNGQTMATVPTEHKFDWGFAKKAPWGLLMTAEAILPAIAVLILLFAPFRYEGMSFFAGTAVSLSLMAGLILLGHVLGLQRRVFELGNGIVLFIPFCLIYFGVSVLFFFIFAFNTMMCVINLLDSFRFTLGMIVSYALMTCLSAATTIALFRSSVLLFRAAPNSKIMDLITVLIEGDKTVRTPGSVPQFSPATSPMGFNAV